MDFSKSSQRGLEGQVNVLVADDESTIREILKRRLERLGYTIYEAENGRKAFELVEKGTYHLIISDIRMPEMTGTELVQAMRERNYATPIILMTGDPGDNNIPPGIPIFTKPFGTQFYEYIEKHARRYSRPPQP